LIVKLISRVVGKSGKQEKLPAGIEKNMIRHPARSKNSTKFPEYEMHIIHNV